MAQKPRIDISPLGKPVTVKLHDAVLASSENALSLKEGDYPPVIYIPREDVYLEHMTRTDKTTHCPHKGDAHYFRISAVGEALDNAAWTYEEPQSEVRQIAGFVAFYPDRLSITVG